MGMGTVGAVPLVHDQATSRSATQRGVLFKRQYITSDHT